MTALGKREFWLQHLAAFRRGQPEGINFFVAADVTKPFTKKHTGLRVEFVGLDSLIRRLGEVA